MNTRLLVALAALCVLAGITVAERTRPTIDLPRVPRGFNEGRTDLVKEASEGFIRPHALVERLYEEADVRELAEFVFKHLKPTEKAALGKQLELENKLPRLRDADGVEQFFNDNELRPGAIATAIGRILEDDGYTLSDVLTWLYLRGHNYRVLQSAMNGERIDCFMRRRQIREALRNDGHGGQMFELGFWTLNLLDGRDEAGGHYDGVQLVEGLLAVGFGPAEFAAVTRRESADDLSAEQRTLIEWGDPSLLWDAIKLGVPESELARDTMRYLREHGDPAAIAQAGLNRKGTIKRWFRTGGPGVTAVYAGPWPDSEGAPEVPMATVRELEDVSDREFVRHIGDDLLEHFNHEERELVLVIYDDGSARAMIRTGREVNYGHASPPGNRLAGDRMYEGRISLRGANGLMYAVFAGEGELTPPELDFVNVRKRAGGALLRLDLDDGVVLTPMLLRRTSRLIEAP
jgi:hypothetical protein